MSKFTYYIPKLQYPQKGLIKTIQTQFSKFSLLKKFAFLTSIVILLLQLAPWYEIGTVPIHATSGITSFAGILIIFFTLSVIIIFAGELIEVDLKFSKENLYKWILFASFEIFILSAIGFSISNNLNTITQEARPLIGSFLSLLFSLILFIESVALNTYEKPIQKTGSVYLIQEDNLEDSLDKYLEKRSKELEDEDDISIHPSKEQTQLFDE